MSCRTDLIDDAVVDEAEYWIASQRREKRKRREEMADWQKDGK